MKREERRKQVARQNRIINVLVSISIALGVFVLLGTIGNLDYSAEIRENYPMILSIKNIVIGVALIVIPFIVRCKCGEE